MADLIDRQALLDRLGFDVRMLGHVKPGSTFDIIIKARSVDAVEVVRCAGCVYFLEENLLCTHEGNMVFNTGKTTYGSCFCSYGDRRPDNV